MAHCAQKSDALPTDRSMERASRDRSRSEVQVEDVVAAVLHVPNGDVRGQIHRVRLVDEGRRQRHGSRGVLLIENGDHPEEAVVAPVVLVRPTPVQSMNCASLQFQRTSSTPGVSERVGPLPTGNERKGVRDPGKAVTTEPAAPATKANPRTSCSVGTAHAGHHVRCDRRGNQRLRARAPRQAAVASQRRRHSSPGSPASSVLPAPITKPSAGPMNDSSSGWDGTTCAQETGRVVDASQAWVKHPRALCDGRAAPVRVVDVAGEAHAIAVEAPRPSHACRTASGRYPVGVRSPLTR